MIDGAIWKGLRLRADFMPLMASSRIDRSNRHSYDFGHSKQTNERLIKE